MVKLSEAKIKELGIELPVPPKPVAAYVPAVKVGKLIFCSGQLPVLEGELGYKGKVGGELTETDGYQAARLCALNCLSVVKEVAGSLDNVARVVKVTGYVNSAPGFTRQPFVINGASDLLVETFREAGYHARSAVGVSELPLNAAVEVEMVVEMKES
ncbi:MAG: RidA family protein [Bacillota bacterium]